MKRLLFIERRNEMAKIIEGVVSLAVKAFEAAVVLIVAEKFVKLYNEKSQKKGA